MTALANTCGPSDTVLVLSAPYTVASPYPLPITIASENIDIVGGNGTNRVTVIRGGNGTSPVSHTAGTAVTAGWGGGGGSLSATDGTTTVADVTSLSFSPGSVTDAGAGVAEVDPPLTATLSEGLYIIQTPQGAQGAGAFTRYQEDPGTGAGGTIALSGGDGVTGFAGGRASIFGGGGNGVGGPQSTGGEVDAFAGAANGTGGRVELLGGQPGTGTGMPGGDVRVTTFGGDGAGRHGLVFLNLPTSDPAVAGALWADSGIVTVSAG